MRFVNKRIVQSDGDRKILPDGIAESFCVVRRKQNVDRTVCSGKILYEPFDVVVVVQDKGLLAKLFGCNRILRLGTVEDVANMVLFLASDESSHVTGAEFIIDGGATAR